MTRRRLIIEGINMFTLPITRNLIVTDSSQALRAIACLHVVTKINYDGMDIPVKDYKLSFLLLP